MLIILYVVEEYIIPNVLICLPIYGIQCLIDFDVKLNNTTRPISTEYIYIYQLR